MSRRKHYPSAFPQVLACGLGAALLGLGLPALLESAPTGAVSVAVTSPPAGAIVSNTVAVTALASSTAAPIQRIELYVDGTLLGATNFPPPAPTGLRVATP